jgi:tetraacyldisaccharide-1-P 4'-kinase
MTEKDAVKLGHISSDKYWAVPVDMAIDAVEAGPWLEQIESRLRSEMESK